MVSLRLAASRRYHVRRGSRGPLSVRFAFLPIIQELKSTY